MKNDIYDPAISRERMPKLSLRAQFWIWIFLGLFILILWMVLPHLSVCPPEKPIAWGLEGYEYPEKHKGDPKTIKYVISQIQEKTSIHIKQADTSGKKDSARWLCEERKSTDLALVFFTYCLVIVGWFAMRSTDETSKHTQRAHIWMSHATCIWSPTEGGWNVNVAYVMKNSGNTIGFVKYVALAGGISESLPINRIDLKIKETINQILIPPQEERPWFNMKLPAVFTEEQFQWATAGMVNLYIFGEIYYTDIFGQNHQSGFAYRVQRNENNEAVTTIVPGRSYWNYT